jgi:hypothetical protein
MFNLGEVGKLGKLPSSNGYHDWWKTYCEYMYLHIWPWKLLKGEPPAKQDSCRPIQNPHIYFQDIPSMSHTKSWSIVSLRLLYVVVLTRQVRCTLSYIIVCISHIGTKRLHLLHWQWLSVNVATLVFRLKEKSLHITEILHQFLFADKFDSFY